MNRQLVMLSAMAVIGAGAGDVSASTITLGMDTGEEPTAFRGVDVTDDGTVTIGIVRGFFVQRYLARVTADDGLPVSECLAEGSDLRLVDAAGTIRARSGRCPNPEGMFEMRPVGAASIQTPTRLRGVIASPTSTAREPARRLAAAASNTVVMRVGPMLLNESPKSFSGSGAFPVQFRVSAPAAGRRGTFTIYRKGKTLTPIASLRPDRVGRVRTSVSPTAAATTYLVVFRPTAGTGWLPTYSTLTIRRPATTPAAPTPAVTARS